MEIEMHVLGLPNFEDDRIVFETKEIERINKKMKDCMENLLLSGEEPETIGGWRVYRLDPEKLYTEKSNNSKKPYIKRSRNFEINLAEIGYYHHRVIMRFGLEDDFYVPEKSKKKLKQLIVEMIDECIEKDEYVKEKSLKNRLKPFANYMIYGCVGKRIKELEFSGEVEEKGKIKFYIRKRVKNRLRELTNEMIDKCVKEKMKKLEFPEKVEEKKKIRFYIQEKTKKRFE